VPLKHLIGDSPDKEVTLELLYLVLSVSVKLLFSYLV